MRREEEEEDVTSRERRGGRRWGSPMLGVIRRKSLLERGGGTRCAGIWNAGARRGPRRGKDDASIRNTKTFS